MITKKQFMAAAKAIVDQVNTDHKISEALKTFCPHSYGFYETTMLTSMLDLLAASAGDEDRWFDYWLFELEQGKKHKRGSVKIDGKRAKLKTLDDVWNIIKKQEKKEVKIKASECFKNLFAAAQKSPHYHAQKHQLEIAEAVYNYKQKHSLTVKELADISGISIVRLHEILKANANLTILSMARLAMALDMELSIEMKEKEVKA